VVHIFCGIKGEKIPMQQKPKRPPSVWISQILVFLFGVLILAMTFSMFVMLSRGSASSIPIGIYLVLGLYVLVGILFFIAFWGLTTRKRFGRWLAVGLLSLMLILMTVGQVVRPSGPMEYAEYENNTQRISGTITQIVIGGLFLFLIFRLGFGKPASNFFNPAEELDEIAAPPPPPTFAE
jgi:hypothetical protein